jgi:hypothetical protein
MAYGTVNTDIVSDSSGGKLAPISSVFRNRIINGSMVIDQRNAGASVTITNTGAITYTLDRWAAYGNIASKFSVQQNAGSVTAPVGFTNYLGVTSLSAYSVSSADTFTLRQNIEGFNTADLNWGTANAKTVTLSFWVRSSLTGTFGGALRNYDANRAYPFSYTISSANTWEQKSVTIAGDTSGTWVGATNSVGITILFGLGVGSSSSGTAGAWAAGAFESSTGATSVVGTNGATFYITGVQLEVGSSATGFEYRQYGTELALCQRYYQKISASNAPYQQYATGTWETSAVLWVGVPLKVTMRSQPTFASSGTSIGTSYGSAGTLTTDVNQTGVDVGVFGWSNGSGGAAGAATFIRSNGNTAGFISFIAEL